MSEIIRQRGLAISFRKIIQGERAVGLETVKLVDASTPCAMVWIGAPMERHAHGGLNSEPILIGGETGPEGNTAGGQPLEPDDHAGFYLWPGDASLITLTGFAEGDVVEYQILVA